MKIEKNTWFKILAGLVALFLVVMFVIRYSTKAHSPADTAVYEGKDLDLKIIYNRPYKKEREIFGKLVPYNEVWRTGANEATTFETSEDLMVDGSLLPKGKYTLWTIPMENSWKVIFNNKMYPWGIDSRAKAYRDSQFDTLVLEVPIIKLTDPQEQFTIFFKKEQEFVLLNMAWDHTLVSVPIKTEKEATTALLFPN